MCCCRTWGLLILAVILLAPAAVRAQDVKSVETIADAVQQLKDTADPKAVAADRMFKQNLKKARDILVEKREKALPAVVALLNESNVQIRVNAAIVLAACAETDGTPPEALVRAWKTCLADQNSGVVYWGLIGTLDSKVSAAEKKDALGDCLKSSRPRILRIAAARAAAKRSFEEAAPQLVKYLQDLLPAYRMQLKTVLERDKIRIEGDRRETEMEPDMMREQPVKRGRRGGRRAAKPKAGPSDLKLAAEKEIIDPDKLRDYDKIRDLISEVQALPACEELHLAGYVLEGLVSKDPTESKFDFKKTPPWALEKCVEKAVAWLKKNNSK